MQNKKEIALQKIAKEIENCKECRRNKIGLAVPGEGSANAKVVFLGEAPGNKEAQTGHPFVGAAGKILRESMAEVNIDPEDVFITSPVKYLPKYVTPTLKDIIHGRKHLLDQLAVIKPKIIVLMGRTAVLAMLNKAVAITKQRGKIIKQDRYTYMIFLHPAAILYSRKLYPFFKQDFKILKKLITKT